MDADPLEITPSFGAEEARERLVKMTGVAALASLATTLAFMSFYISQGWWGPVSFNVPVCAGYAAVYFLNRKFRSKSVTVVMFLLIILQLTVIVNVFSGKESGIHYYLLSLTPFIFLIFSERKDLKLILPIALLDLAAFLISEYATLDSPYRISASEGVLKALHVASTTGTISLISFFMVVFYLDINRARRALDMEHRRSESLLLNILPAKIADRLKVSPDTIAEEFPSASVLFADMVGFTELAGRLDPDELVGVLNRYFSAYDDIAAGLGVEKIKTIGDAYMAAAGIPEKRDDHAEAVLKAAVVMLEATGRINAELGLELRIRIGINSGRVTAGVIGKRKFAYDLWGDAVNVASRMESHGVPGRIQVSRSTYDFLKDSYEFEQRGSIDVKGKGPLDVFLLKTAR